MFYGVPAYILLKYVCIHMYALCEGPEQSPRDEILRTFKGPQAHILTLYRSLYFGYTHLDIGLVTKMGLNQVTGWLGGVSHAGWDQP